MQNELPFRRGSATNLPRESVILDDEVIEHRCPDLIVPQQRAGKVGASMASDQRAEMKPLQIYGNCHTNKNTKTTLVRAVTCLLRMCVLVP